MRYWWKDLRENWRKYVINVLILYVVFQTLNYVANWFARGLPGGP